MPEFQDFKSAFQWWLDNVYPDLPTEEKEKIKHLKYNFKKNRPLSNDKIEELIKTFNEVDIIIRIK